MADIMEIPGREAEEKEKIGWLQELTTMGRRFLELQPGWADIDKAKQLLSGATEQRRGEGVSDVSVNFVARYFKELIAQQTNLSPKWGYKAENKKFLENEKVLDRCFKAWWQVSYGELKVKEAKQLSGLGKGYLSPVWNPNYRGPGKGDIELKVYGPKDVYPVMLPADGNLQEAFAVIIKEEMPIHQARATWPQLRHKIVPTRGSATWLGQVGNSNMANKVVSPVLNMLGLERTRKEFENVFPTVDIFYAYIKDYSINETGRTQAFGQPGTPWYYEVPHFGAPIKTGVRRPTGQVDQMGQPIFEDVTRPANADDARLYPNRRLVIFCDTCIIKDDTSPWWHGLAPVVPFDIYRWAWEYLSRPYPATVMDLQSTYNDLLRTIVDSANLRLDPPLAFDKRAHSMQQMKTFTPRKPGGRLQMDLAYGVTVKPLMDPKYYDVPSWLMETMQSLPELMQKMSGINNPEDFARAAQIPSDDTIDKIMDLQGPLVEDQAREMERSLQLLGEMVKWIIFEFYTTARRIQILGEDGLTQDDFDYEPGLMIPDHMPGEDPEKPSEYSLAERARQHAANFLFYIVPNSSYNVTDAQRKMLYLQLFRGGFPIDPGTVADTLGIPNWGDLGDGTVVEKYARWEEMKAKFAVNLQMETQQMMMAAQGPEQLIEQAIAGGFGSPKQGVGRPPSGNKPPHMEQKNGPDGPRTVISES